MKVVAIINPVSGASASARTAESRRAFITAALDRRQLTGDVRFTERAGHAREMAQAAAADGADLVIAWGGDGTINEAGAGLLGSKTPLGIIPAGSGNGLASALTCPHDPAVALDRIMGGPVRAIDAGFLAGHPFFNIAGIGVDARIATLFNRQPLGARGLWPYIRIGVAEGCRYRSRDYEVELDGVAQHVRALLIAFANGREYGNGITLCAAASLDDGLLDASIIEDRPVLARFWHARYLAAGTPERAPRVTSRQIRRAVVSTAGPIEYHLDGEPGVAAERVEIEIRPRALLVKG